MAKDVGEGQARYASAAAWTIASATNDIAAVSLAARTAGSAERQAQADLLREIARSIYDNRAFDALPQMAVALEEAGCTDAEMIEHCRQAGDHVRGCWVVDFCLIGSK